VRPLGASGAALVLVLVAASVMALLALTSSFVVALDGLAARSAQQAARAEGQAEGALQLAARQVMVEAAAGALSDGPLGPWPGAGIDAVAVVEVHGSYVSVRARAEVGHAALARSLVLALPVRSRRAPVVWARP